MRAQSLVGSRGGSSATARLCTERLACSGTAAQPGRSLAACRGRQLECAWLLVLIGAQQRVALMSWPITTEAASRAASTVWAPAHRVSTGPLQNGCPHHLRCWQLQACVSPLACLQGNCPLQHGRQPALGPSITATALCTQAQGTLWPLRESCPLRCPPPCTQQRRGRNPRTPLCRRCSMQQPSARPCRRAWQPEQLRDSLMALCNSCLSAGGAALLRDGQPRPYRSVYMR